MQENAKEQSALQQLQFNETKSLLMKEREAAKKAAEVPVVREVPVIDTAIMEKLSAENEKLKALVSSLEKKIDETEKKCEETSKISEERLKKAVKAEAKIVHLVEAMQRLEEKLSNMESEEQRVIPHRKPPPPMFLFGRMAQGFRSSANLPVEGVDIVRQVEAKYPALLFKQQLTAYVEKIYGIIRDINVEECH